MTILPRARPVNWVNPHSVPIGNLNDECWQWQVRDAFEAGADAMLYALINDDLLKNMDYKNNHKPWIITHNNEEQKMDKVMNINTAKKEYRELFNRFAVELNNLDEKYGVTSDITHERLENTIFSDEFRHFIHKFEFELKILS